MSTERGREPVRCRVPTSSHCHMPLARTHKALRMSRPQAYGAPQRVESTHKHLQSSPCGRECRRTQDARHRHHPHPAMGIAEWRNHNASIERWNCARHHWSGGGWSSSATSVVEGAARGADGVCAAWVRASMALCLLTLTKLTAARLVMKCTVDHAKTSVCIWCTSSRKSCACVGVAPRRDTPTSGTSRASQRKPGQAGGRALLAS